MQGAARTCNGAFEECYKHPWSTKAHTLAKLLLPCLVADLLSNDGIPHRHHFIHQFAMQTLAMSCQFPFLASQALSGCLVPLTVMPGLAALLASPLLIKVLWIIGTQLSV